MGVSSRFITKYIYKKSKLDIKCTNGRTDERTHKKMRRTTKKVRQRSGAQITENVTAIKTSAESSKSQVCSPIFGHFKVCCF